MKALYNPHTGMVMEWTKLRSKMDNLQEIEVADRSALSKKYEGLEPAAAPMGGFPQAGKKYKEDAPVGDGIEHAEPAKAPPKKKAAKKKVTAKSHTADAAIAAPEPVGDGFGVNDI